MLPKWMTNIKYMYCLKDRKTVITTFEDVDRATQLFNL